MVTKQIWQYVVPDYNSNDLFKSCSATWIELHSKQKTSLTALDENMFSACFPWIQRFFCLFFQNTKNQTIFHFCGKTDGIILLCFLFVCVGNSLTVFQANTSFTCILTLFSWNTETIPSSGICVQRPMIQPSGPELGRWWKLIPALEQCSSLATFHSIFGIYMKLTRLTHIYHYYERG